MNFNLNFFNKNYKYISESESSENLLSSIQNSQAIEISPVNKNGLVKNDSNEFSDFVQAVILDNDIDEFANFDVDIFIENEVNDVINDLINDVIINDEVKNTVDYLINYCEEFNIEYKYELFGYINNFFYKENNIFYFFRLN